MHDAFLLTTINLRRGRVRKRRKSRQSGFHQVLPKRDRETVVTVFGPYSVVPILELWKTDWKNAKNLISQIIISIQFWFKFVVEIFFQSAPKRQLFRPQKRVHICCFRYNSISVNIVRTNYSELLRFCQRNYFGISSKLWACCCFGFIDKNRFVKRKLNIFGGIVNKNQFLVRLIGSQKSLSSSKCFTLLLLWSGA